MAEWFKDWFASDEYLYVYKHRDKNDACELVKLIVEDIELPKSARILDFACGTGRHSLLFAQRGFNVTGFDLSKNLLKIGKRTACNAGLKVDFFCTDIRQVCLKKKFDLAVNLFTSFGYFENDDENFKLFGSVFNHLKKGSYFVFDYLNAEFVKNNLPRDTKDVDSGNVMIQKRFIEKNRVKKIIHIKKGDTEKQFLESVRLYYPDDIKCMLSKFGFDIKKIFGNYSGGEFNYYDSPRIIIFAQK
jgi:SAM-dependent methyltransferase